MPTFDPRIMQIILHARENDPRHVVSRDDAKRIGEAVEKALALPGADPAAVAEALRFVGYGAPTARAQSLIDAANRRLDATCPIVVVGNEGAPYAAIEADLWDPQTRRLRPTKVRVSQALLTRAGEALDQYARKYVRSILEGGDPLTDAEIQAEMDLVSEQLSITYFEDSDRGTVSLSGSSAGSDNLPETAFSVLLNKKTGEITGFSDAD